MNFDREHVVALNEIRGRKSEWPLRRGSANRCARQSAVTGSSGGHVPAECFLAVKVEDGAIVDGIGERQGDTAWARTEVKVRPEIERVLARICETEVSVSRSCRRRTGVSAPKQSASRRPGGVIEAG